MEESNSKTWSTTALLGSDSETSNDKSTRPAANTMQPSPSLSQLMKRRRRRCGGVFKSVGGASKDFAIEYDWPYQRPSRVSAAKLSIEISTANEAFFRRSNIEISRFSSSSGSSSSALDMGSRRKYSFERDSDTVRIEKPAARNLATRDDASTRSPSVYSQKSGVSPLEDPKKVDLRLRKLSSLVPKPTKPLQWPQRSSSLAVPKLVPRIRNNSNSSDASTSARKQDLQSANPEVKLIRSSSTTFESIRHVSSKLGARTRPFTKIFTEKASDLKIRKGRPRRAAGGQRDVLKDVGESSEVGRGNHALGRNAEHGAMSSIDPPLRRDHAGGNWGVRQFLSSDKQKGGRQRKVY